MPTLRSVNGRFSIDRQNLVTGMETLRVRGWVAGTDNENHQRSAPGSPGSSPSPRCDANNHTLPQSGRLLYCVQHYAATGGISEELLILPPGAIQSCHLIRIGLDCQIPLSAAAWRLQSEKQAVRCGLPVTRAQCAVDRLRHRLFVDSNRGFAENYEVLALCFIYLRA